MARIVIVIVLTCQSAISFALSLFCSAPRTPLRSPHADSSSSLRCLGAVRGARAWRLSVRMHGMQRANAIRRARRRRGPLRARARGASERERNSLWSGRSRGQGDVSARHQALHTLRSPAAAAEWTHARALEALRLRLIHAQAIMRDERRAAVVAVTLSTLLMVVVHAPPDNQEQDETDETTGAREGDEPEIVIIQHRADLPRDRSSAARPSASSRDRRGSGERRWDRAGTRAPSAVGNRLVDPLAVPRRVL